MGPTGWYCEPGGQRPGAKRWSGAIRYRVKVPVMSMMPIPTSNDPEATAEPDQEERNAEPERVHDEQENPARGALGARDEEDPGQHRADAGRPPGGEGHAERERAGDAGTHLVQERPALGVQRDRPSPQGVPDHQHTKGDDDEPRDRLPRGALEEPDGRCERAQQREHEGESADEQHDREQSSSRRPLRLARHPTVNRRRTGDERQVAGNQREHAGTGERHDARDEGERGGPPSAQRVCGVGEHGGCGSV